MLLGTAHNSLVAVQVPGFTCHCPLPSTRNLSSPLSLAPDSAAKARYSVDIETEGIRIATTTDQNHLTWDEAYQLSEKMKKEVTEKGGGLSRCPWPS